MENTMKRVGVTITEEITGNDGAAAWRMIHYFDA
jgi:hypothetical protein